MGKTLIIIGLGIAYLCWITRRGYDYIGQKSIENGAESLEEKTKHTREQLQNNEKVTVIERLHLWNFYASRFVYSSLIYGTYAGLILSIIGIILLIIK